MVLTSGKKVAKMELRQMVSLGFLSNARGKTELHSENCQAQNICLSTI